MAQEATGLGVFLTSTRHMRQFPAMERRLWLEGPSCPLGLSRRTDRRTLRSRLPGWGNGLGLQPQGTGAMEEGDLESGSVSFGFRGSIQRVFLNIYFRGQTGGYGWRPPTAVRPCTTAL
nr:hypothetical protein CFP56_35246 [Quercus suber]